MTHLNLQAASIFAGQELALAQVVQADFVDSAGTTIHATLVESALQPRAVRLAAGPLIAQFGFPTAIIHTGEELTLALTAKADFVDSACAAVKSAQVRTTFQAGAVGLTALAVETDLAGIAARIRTPGILAHAAVAQANLVGAARTAIDTTKVRPAIEPSAIRLATLVFETDLAGPAA